jgi:hypothetical protein
MPQANRSRTSALVIRNNDPLPLITCRPPAGDSLIERLAAGISQAAEHEKDPERKRRLLSVAPEFGGAVKASAANVASAILEHRLRADEPVTRWPGFRMSTLLISSPDDSTRYHVSTGTPSHLEGR